MANMRKSPAFLFLIVMIFAVCSNKPVWCWDDKVTHKDLTDYAADLSVLAPSKGDYLRTIGFENFNEMLLWSEQVCDDDTRMTKCSIKDWLKYGAEKEDNWKILTLDPSLRMLNHFHEPINGRGLYGPLLDDFNYLFNTDISPQSALEWAQDVDRQTSETLEGDQSWLTLRRLYYIALTQTDDSIRKETFAKLGLRGGASGTLHTFTHLI